MALYMYQAAYTNESWAALLKNPQDRIETAAKPACEAVSGRVVCGAYCFGEYDIVIIADVPDDASMSAVAMAVAAGGAVKTAKTTKLLSGAQGIEAMRKAAAVGKAYRPAR